MVRDHIFALDLANAQLAAALGAVVTGWAVDAFAVRSVVLASATLSLLPAGAWVLALPWLRRHASPEVN